MEIVIRVPITQADLGWFDNGVQQEAIDWTPEQMRYIQGVAFSIVADVLAGRYQEIEDVITPDVGNDFEGPEGVFPQYDWENGTDAHNDECSNLNVRGASTAIGIAEAIYKRMKEMAKEHGQISWAEEMGRHKGQ